MKKNILMLLLIFGFSMPNFAQYEYEADFYDDGTADAYTVDDGGTSDVQDAYIDDGSGGATTPYSELTSPQNLANSQSVQVKM